MNKRTAILCASFGSLVLSAAHVSLPLGSLSPSGPPTLSHARDASPSSSEQTAELPPAPASLNRLRAAYAQADTRSSTSAPGPASPTGPDRFSETVAPPRTVGVSEANTSEAAGPSATVVPPREVEASTLWLARAIYSETKLPHEQELVAWVIRNRVETGYRGKDTYREVVLDPYQFSAFNPGSSKRPMLKRLGPETPLPQWQQALWVARYVRHAAPAYRPFSIETRHFYSERSMKGRAVPYWAERAGTVPPEGRRYTVDKRRFRFYKQIS